jgi:hypothetical protein
MDTTTSMLLAGSLVVIGRWVQDKPVNARIVIGIVGSALFLSLVSQADERLAKSFGAMVLLTATFVYAPAILKKVGLIS